MDSGSASQVRRESKASFWDRVEQEGRRQQAEAGWRELLAAGRTKREAQAELVERFQPLDGSRTVALQTPDPWRCGRKTWRKPPPSPEQQRDEAVVWAYKHFADDIAQAPTGEAAFWLKIARTNQVRFYLDHYLPAQERQQLRRREGPRSALSLAYDKGWEDGYREGVEDTERAVADDQEDEENEYGWGDDESEVYEVPPSLAARVPRATAESSPKPVAAPKLAALPSGSVAGKANPMPKPAVPVSQPPLEAEAIVPAADVKAAEPAVECPDCYWMPPGDPDCPRCKAIAERDRQRLEGPAPGNLLTDDPRLKLPGAAWPVRTPDRW